MTWRALFGLPIAGAIVAFLFLWMAGMVAPADFLPEPKEPFPDVTLPEVPPDTQPPPPPPNPGKIDPPPPLVIDPPGPIDPNPIPGRQPLPATAPGAFVIVPPNKEKRRLVVVQPTGFERCISSNSQPQERVRLQFDISPTGETANVEAVSSTDTCYERSAIRAVAQWRYEPAVRDNEPVWSYGEQTTVVFEIQ